MIERLEVDGHDRRPRRRARRLDHVAGDTIWCDEVEDALAEHGPDVVVVNAGAARFLEGDPIIMDAGDVIETARAAPRATIVAVHLEALNHCLLTREALRTAVHEAHPEVPIWTAALDRELDENAFIRPGLGDAGDRVFGTSG